MTALGKSVVASATRSVFEALERRAMLSASVQDGVWYLAGDDNPQQTADTITVYLNAAKTQLKATINGDTATVIDVADIEGIQIDAGEGDDIVNINLKGLEDTLWVDIYGGAGNDSLTGGTQSDNIYGEDGNDTINGLGGDDWLSGGEGEDSVVGGDGDDIIYGGGGNDQAIGGMGDDSLWGGAGNDDLEGRQGNDDLVGNTGDDTIDGGGGADDAWGGAGADNLNGGRGADDLHGGAGDDSVDGSAGDDTLTGNAGDDLVLGGSGNDDQWGNGGEDTLSGGLGKDDLLGGDGSDNLHGGYDDDTIYGGTSDDTLSGDDGADSLDGGDGSDTVFTQPDIDYTKYDQFDVTQADQRLNVLTQVTEPEALKSWLIDRAMTQYKDLLGTSYSPWWDWGIRFRGAVDGLAYNATPSPQAVSSDHSNTNTQTAGVDEADLVKTDGDYLYVLSGNHLAILKTQPADQTTLVGQIDIEGSPQGIYLDGDKVTVISTTWEYDDAFRPMMGRMAYWGGYYGGWGKTKLTVVDVSDRTAPTIAEETKLDGTLSDSRSIDGRVYAVMNGSLQLPRPDVTYTPAPEEPTDPTSDINLWYYPQGTYTYESAESYRARLEAMSIADMLPHYTRTVHNADGTTTVSTGDLADLSNFYVPAGQTNDYLDNLFSVVEFKPAQGLEPVATTNVLGCGGEIYASATSLYVTRQSWDWQSSNWTGESRTDIYKFSLGDSSVTLDATGEVPGWIVNSFALDESSTGVLRVATTSSSTDGTANNVFALEDQGDHLAVIGGITGLAMSERIYAARFVGDRGYLVTYRQTDPLFTLDLSDPTNITVGGHLKIPGYSSYLHPIDENHLLAIGRNGDAAGHVLGLQVSLFDVTDAQNPKRVDVFNFDEGNAPSWIWGGGNWSAAEWDHHAFSYFPESGILAIPVQSWGYDANGGWTNNGGLAVLHVDPQAGFTDLGRVTQDWSTNRSVRIGQFLYAIGDTQVKVVPLLDPTQTTAIVDLPGWSSAPDVGIEGDVIEADPIDVLG